VAFDFFVTAFSVIASVSPNSKRDRDMLQAKDPLLSIVGHLCNGAKHFEAKAWRQVTRSEFLG
jgi:hypothetical protein